VPDEKPMSIATAFTWLQIGQHDLASRKQTTYILRLEEDTIRAFRKMRRPTGQRPPKPCAQ